MSCCQIYSNLNNINDAKSRYQKLSFKDFGKLVRIAIFSYARDLIAKKEPFSLRQLKLFIVVTF